MPELKLHRSFIHIVLLSLACLLLLPSVSANFPDVPQNHDNFVSIKYLKDAGIIKGYEDGTFQPERLVNRAEAVKVILEGTQLPLDTTGITNNFTDVTKEAWFIDYLLTAQKIGIVKGNPDGSFAPGRTVNKGEFLKMLLEANRFNETGWATKWSYNDVNEDAWYAPYMVYAAHTGIITPDEARNLHPGAQLTRGDIAEILYMLRVVRSGDNLEFLTNQATKHLLQIEFYMDDGDVYNAKKNSTLAVDLSMQAYSLNSVSPLVVSTAKAAKAYDFVLTAFIAATEGNTDEAKAKSEEARQKATEAWELNNDMQPLAAHIKKRADEILTQVE